MSSMASSLSHREKEKLAKFRGGTQSFRQWMLSIERQIGSEDPRLWMLSHRTIDFTMPIVQKVIEDYVTNMRDDTVYWQSLIDGTAKGEFAYRYTELSTLVRKLYYRLLDALEDEALACVETQQVARNGCEVLRLLKSRYALETQYIETDLITKVHTWTFDKNDLERSIIEWERLIHRLSTQHNFKFEPRQLFAILYSRTSRRSTIDDESRWRCRFLGSSRTSNRVLSKQATFRSVSFKRSQFSHGCSQSEKEPRKESLRDDMPKANLDFRGSRKDEENKEKARVRRNTITHRCSITFSMVIHDRIFMCHCRYRTSSDWYEEAGNHENRP